MSHLSTGQLLYLLYVKAYSDKDSVTKSNVKSCLSKELQKDAEQSYQELLRQKLIETPKKSRIAITNLGIKVLVENLQKTEYRFNFSKGPKVINTLLDCLQLMAVESQSQSMDFDTYVEKFKVLYFEERKRQELTGVVAIHSKELCHKFKEFNSISQSQLDEYFDKLKSEGKIFAVTEKGEELIQWAE
jgi:hypothetical protein